MGNNSAKPGASVLPAPTVPAIQARTNITVIVCSKLPVSLTLRNPLDKTTKVTIRGLNTAPRGSNGDPIAVPYMTTKIDADFWAAWEGAHGLKAKHVFPAIKSGALFAAETDDEANGINRENEKRGTGMEGMSRDFDKRMGTKKEQVATAVD